MNNSNNHGHHAQARSPSGGQQVSVDFGEAMISNDQFQQGHSQASGGQGLLSGQLPSVSVQQPFFAQQLSTVPSNIAPQQPSFVQQYSDHPVNVGSHQPPFQFPLVGSALIQNNNQANEFIQQLANQVAQLPGNQNFAQAYGSLNQGSNNFPLSASLDAAPVEQPNPSLQFEGAVDGNSPRKTISQGATIIPCRARAIAKDHNEKVNCSFVVISCHGD